MEFIMKATKVKEGIYWVGAVDWDIRNFHGYSTEEGTSYGAYLIVDEKITLIDTVKAPFADEMLSRISDILPPEKIDIIIITVCWLCLFHKILRRTP